MKLRLFFISFIVLTIAFFAMPNASGQWVKVSDTSMAPVNAIVVNNGVLLAGTTSGFFISTDSGSTWVGSNRGLQWDNTYVTSLASEDTTVYAGVLLGGVYKSTDFGKRWTQSSAGLISGDVWNVFAHENLLFTGTPSQGIFRSTDSGSSWDSVDVGLPPPHSVSQIFFLGTTTFACVDVDFYQSNDSGAHWSIMSSPEVPFALNTSLIVGSTIYAGGFPGLYTSTDTGSTWTQAPSDSSIFSLTNFNSISFAGTQYGNVLVSKDNGMNWLNTGSGLPNTTIKSLAVGGGYLFAGISNGIWRRPLSDFNQSGVSESTAANTSGAVQVFPNPASGELQIMCGEVGEVHLFDLMGRERMNAAMEGSSATLDVSHLEAGMYFLRLGNQSTKVEITH